SGLERRVRGVHAVRLAVDQVHPDVHDGEALLEAPLHLSPDALLDARDEVVRDCATDDLVDELEPGPARQRLDLAGADRLRAVPPGLLDVAALGLYRPGEGLAQGPLHRLGPPARPAPAPAGQ